MSGEELLQMVLSAIDDAIDRKEYGPYNIEVYFKYSETLYSPWKYPRSANNVKERIEILELVTECVISPHIGVYARQLV